MQTFQERIKAEKPVLVDFSAEWCGPCKMMAPILKELAGNMADKISILKVDVDQNPGAAMQYNIQGVPTLILFRKGQVLWRQAGVLPANRLEQIVRQYI